MPSQQAPAAVRSEYQPPARESIAQLAREPAAVHENAVAAGRRTAGEEEGENEAAEDEGRETETETESGERETENEDNEAENQVGEPGGDAEDTVVEEADDGNSGDSEQSEGEADD
jgi:hypothetical protein